jgi:N-formylglutamate deformylase
VQTLQNADYSFSHNYPFKGGYITRHYGQPHLHRHALQLEMSKVNYMDDSETEYDEVRAGKMQEVLKSVLNRLIESLY